MAEYIPGRAVVFFSGGMDSFVNLSWANTRRKFQHPRPVALYVNFHHRYAEREIAAARALCPKLGPTSLWIRDLSLADIEDAKSRIPLRNFYLLFAGTYYGDNLVFGMLRNEQPRDKRPATVYLAQQLLRSQYAPERKIEIHCPFSRMTKTEMLAWYFNQFGTSQKIKDLILETIGCYDPRGNCGRCISCFNRWVALVNNNVPGETYAAPPWEWALEQLSTGDLEHTNSVLDSLTQLWYKQKYIREVARAFRLAGVTKTPYKDAVHRWLART
jgi:7-cyano-7-deazaguanine synthase in queuosine biosynthesis